MKLIQKVHDTLNCFFKIKSDLQLKAIIEKKIY
jgi:hypothetical protein